MGDMRRFVSLLLAVPACAGVLALTGCADSGGAERVSVPYTEDAVTIGVGDTLVVDFGQINSSIGDSWELTQLPDEAVLSEGEVEIDVLDEDVVGGYTELAYTFVGESAGTTTIGFTYSYRGNVGDEEGRTQDPTPTIEVRVVEE